MSGLSFGSVDIVKQDNDQLDYQFQPIPVPEVSVIPVEQALFVMNRRKGYVGCSPSH